jgi:hypothetical protein
LDIREARFEILMDANRDIQAKGVAPMAEGHSRIDKETISVLRKLLSPPPMRSLIWYAVDSGAES